MGIELLIVPSPKISDPLAKLRHHFPALWPEREGWVYRSLDFSAVLREQDRAVLVVGEGRLDSGFWGFIRAARAAVAGEVRDVATGGLLNLDHVTPPLAWLLPGAFLAARIRQG
jgi:hypothetical protein